MKVDNYAVPEASCPVCQYVVDQAAAIGYRNTKPRKPRTNDLTICINCGAVLIFTHDAMLRTPTTDELEAIHQLDVWPAMQKVIGLIHEEKEKKSPHEAPERP